MPFKENEVSRENPPQWTFTEVMQLIDEKLQERSEVLTNAYAESCERGTKVVHQLEVTLYAILNNSEINRNLTPATKAKAFRYFDRKLLNFLEGLKSAVTQVQ